MKKIGSLSRRRLLRLSGMGLGAALIAACAPAADTPKEPGLTASPVQQAAPTDTDTAPTAPTVTWEATNTARPTAEQPAADRPFEASDPKNVALAAGRPQLVEFFAFW